MKKTLNLKKNHFKTLEYFQIHLVYMLQKSELSQHHKEILDERIQEAKENPSKYISLNQLKNQIRR